MYLWENSDFKNKFDYCRGRGGGALLTKTQGRKYGDPLIFYPLGLTVLKIGWNSLSAMLQEPVAENLLRSTCLQGTCCWVPVAEYLLLGIYERVPVAYYRAPLASVCCWICTYRGVTVAVYLLLNTYRGLTVAEYLLPSICCWITTAQ